MNKIKERKKKKSGEQPRRGKNKVNWSKETGQILTQKENEK